MNWQKLIILYSGLAFLSLIQVALHGQEPGATYYFDDDEVIFLFDSRLYNQALANGQEAQLDFADLDIYKVAISGTFNKWSKRGWRMKKVGPYTYKLHKKIKEFKDKYTFDFKFVINDTYWVESEEGYSNRIFSNDFWEEVYNLPIQRVEPVEFGNTTLFLGGYYKASTVILTGDFNGWNEDYLKMKKVKHGWELSLELPPGKYEYKFIVDGHWIHDPANQKKIRNEYHTYNSILEVTTPVSFSLKGFENAKKVILAGSFNDWSKSSLKMEQTKDGWKATVNLMGGKHHYKFIIDGKWIIDPANPFQEYDPNGNLNSVLIIQ